MIHQIDFGNDPKLKIEWNNLRGGMLATLSTQNVSIYNINYLGDLYCPKWIKKQCGVAMGFGGKVISFGTDYYISSSVSSSNLKESQTPSTKTKKKLKIPPNININYLPKSQSMIVRAEQFKKTLNALSTVADLRNFTDTKLKTLNSMNTKAISSASNVSVSQSQSQPITKSKKPKDDELDFLADLTDSDEDDEDEFEQNQEQEPESKEEYASNMPQISKSEIDFEIQIWEMIRLFFNDQDCKDDIIEYLGFEKKELVRKQQEIFEKEAAKNQPKSNNNHNLKYNKTKFECKYWSNKQSKFGDDVDDAGFDIGAMGHDKRRNRW